MSALEQHSRSDPGVPTEGTSSSSGPPEQERREDMAAVAGGMLGEPRGDERSSWT